jgi:hypothetical protein
MLAGADEQIGKWKKHADLLRGAYHRLKDDQKRGADAFDDDSSNISGGGGSGGGSEQQGGGHNNHDGGNGSIGDGSDDDCDIEPAPWALLTKWQLNAMKQKLLTLAEFMQVLTRMWEKHKVAARTFRRLFNRFPSHDEAKGALDKWKKGQKVEIEGVAIGAAGEDDSFPDMINKMYSTVKTHRNIIDLDWSFCVDGTEFLA